MLGLLTGWAKPAHYQKDFDALPVRDKKIVRIVDGAVLVILVVLAFSPYVVVR
jgi:hypothetical protein